MERLTIQVGGFEVNCSILSEDGKAWTPLNGSPCRNRGERFAWLTDETDVRSRDVYGSPRISGSGVDIGAVEGLSVGLVISIR